MEDREEDRELEIYIHIPFCVRKCAYCDFLSFAAPAEIRERYVEALLCEIRQSAQREELGGHRVSSVFFGGGTPSLLPGEEIGRILGAVRRGFSVAEDAEITVECNPGTLDAGKLSSYIKAGVNRLSIGLQSAQDAELRALGRIHTWEEFLQSFSLARQAGFSDLNVDLMSALPGQSAAAWEDTLTRVLALRPEHISAYSLIIEEGTPFYEHYGAEAARRDAGEECVLLPSEEEERRMYERTEELLAAAGYHRYEISNYSLPGYECRHNSGYWLRREYRGFGLGAASLIGNMRFSDTEELDQYLAGDFCGAPAQRLTKKEQMEETMFLGLRLCRGVCEETFAREFGVSLQSVYGEVLARLEKQGLLLRRDGRVFLTKRGIDISNYVMAQFL